MPAAPPPDPADLLAATRRFVDEVVLPGVEEWDRADELPDAVFAELVALGLTGALVPSEHGGAGLTVAAVIPVWRVLSQGWISLTGAVNPPGLGATLLVRHGTEARRLPGMAAGTTEAWGGDHLRRGRQRARPPRR